MSNDLVVLTEKTPAVVFTSGKAREFLEEFKTSLKSLVLDVSTNKGRDEIRSVARKIASTKTAIDSAGKELKAEWKQKCDAIDSERRMLWDELEALQAEIRQPLTDFENKEKERIARHEADITEIVNGGQFTFENWQTLTIEAMQDRKAEIEISRDRLDWQEFEARAKGVCGVAIEKINLAIAGKQKHDAEQAELERLRKAEADRIQKEREEAIAKEAAEKAKREAEEKAAAEAKAAQEKAEAEKREIERKAAEEAQKAKDEAERQAKLAEQARLDVERQKKEAEQRAIDAENARIAAEKLAKEQAEAAERKRIADIEAAKQAEIRKQALEAEEAEKERLRREADKANKARVHNDILARLDVELGIEDSLGKSIITAIAQGKIPHVKINY